MSRGFWSLQLVSFGKDRCMSYVPKLFTKWQSSFQWWRAAPLALLKFNIKNSKGKWDLIFCWPQKNFLELVQVMQELSSPPSAPLPSPQPEPLGAIRLPAAIAISVNCGKGKSSLLLSRDAELLLRACGWQAMGCQGPRCFPHSS